MKILGADVELTNGATVSLRERDGYKLDISLRHGSASALPVASICGTFNGPEQAMEWLIEKTEMHGDDEEWLQRLVEAMLGQG